MCERGWEEGEAPACVPKGKLRPLQSCRAEGVPGASVICPTGCGQTVVSMLCEEVVVFSAFWETSRASEGLVDVINPFLGVLS